MATTVTCEQREERSHEWMVKAQNQWVHQKCHTFLGKLCSLWHMHNSCTKQPVVFSDKLSPKLHEIHSHYKLHPPLVWVREESSPEDWQQATHHHRAATEWVSSLPSTWIPVSPTTQTERAESRNPLRANELVKESTYTRVCFLTWVYLCFTCTTRQLFTSF